MSEHHQHEDQPATDPWGLPVEGDAEPAWPEQVPGQETRPADEDEEAPAEETLADEAPEDPTGPPDDVVTAKDALHQVVDAQADTEPQAEPGPASEDEATPEVETPEPEGHEAPAMGQGGAFDDSSGPLSQALAAAKNVISSLQEPPAEGVTAARDEPAGEEPVEEEPVEEEPAPPAAQEEPDEDVAADLPEEPPPWLEDDEETPEPDAGPDVVVEESTVQEISVEISEDVTDVEDVLEDVVSTELAEDIVPEDLELVGEEEVTEETVTIELDEEADEDDLERLAAELAGYADEDDEVVIEEDAVHLERAPEGPDTKAEDEEAPVDTTPSAYAELASMTEPEEPEAPPEEDATETPEEDVTERPGRDADQEPSPEPAGPAADVVQTEAPSVEWGALWKESAQGWVEDEEGSPTWRPIVATTSSLADWEVDTYLGVVGGEVLVGSPGQAGGIRSITGGGRGSEHELTRARAAAVRSMVDDAVARGAHAVIGAEVGYASVGTQILVTASGTAVTLRTRS